jgi:hypothetical protein
MFAFGKKKVKPVKSYSTVNRRYTPRRNYGYESERKAIDSRYTDPSDRWAHEAAWADLDSRYSRFGNPDITYLLKFK